MNRVTAVFLVLLGMATLASGQLWMRARACPEPAEGVLIAGQDTLLDVLLAVLSAVLLILALLGLSRILYRAAPAPPADDAITEEARRA